MKKQKHDFPISFSLQFSKFPLVTTAPPCAGHTAHHIQELTRWYFGGFWESWTFPPSFSSFEVLKEIHLSSFYHKYRKANPNYSDSIGWLPAMCFLVNLMLDGQENIFCLNPCGAIGANSTDQFPLHWQFTRILFCPQWISNCINSHTPPKKK